MSYEIDEEIIETLNNFRMPKYKEIPDVGLYLDQTSKIINQYLQAIPNCELTNSMIANYVKHKLIANPVGKQYYREHIAYLLFIALTKSALSLDDVNKLFNLQKEYSNTENAYNFFVREFENELNVEFGFGRERLEEEMTDEKLLLSSINKVVVSKIVLDEKFKSLKNIEIYKE